MGSPKCEIIIYDGFDDMDAFGVLEALHWASYSVQVKSVRKQDVITTSAGLKIIPAGTFNLNTCPDVLIVPGGGWRLGDQRNATEIVGAELEVEKGELPELLRQFHRHAKESGGVLASVCTGSLILGRTNLLKGRPATTNRQAINQLQEMGAKLMDVRVADDGDIITASGITASLDLGLWLIQRFSGVDAAIAISQQLEFEMRGPIWHR
ncbi:MAG: DJ-1/PfpI family protein [Candidatus Obscuribacterales bacterium]|jgi:putative intracellular protease/amidase|nr:DJ-1/PfpI family protein [Candidatus Obscuribacterales bacterium]